MNRLLTWLLFASFASIGQTRQPMAMTLAQPVSSFDSQGQSRLMALARLGSTTHLSILVEAGSMAFLQQPVSVDVDGQTLEHVITQIVRGPEQYRVRQAGSLLVIYPERPAQPINRILKMPLGPITYHGKTYDDLDMLLASMLQAASGCINYGHGESGGDPPLAIPPFCLSSGTFELIIERAALAPQPTMWVVGPDDGTRGCMPDPLVQVESAFLDPNPSPASSPIRETSGPDFIK